MKTNYRQLFKQIIRLKIQIFDQILSYFDVKRIFKTISKIFFKEFLIK